MSCCDVCLLLKSCVIGPTLRPACQIRLDQLFSEPVWRGRVHVMYCISDGVDLVALDTDTITISRPNYWYYTIRQIRRK